MVTKSKSYGHSFLQEKILKELERMSSENCFIIKKTQLIEGVEKYFYINLFSINAGDIFIWLYVNECMVENKNKNYYFEKFDYNNEEEIAKNLFLLLNGLIEGSEKIFESTFRINILKGGVL